jgi:head-tail adaptor
MVQFRFRFARRKLWAGIASASGDEAVEAHQELVEPVG